MLDTLQNLNIPEHSISPILQVQVEQEEEDTEERVHLRDILHPE